MPQYINVRAAELQRSVQSLKQSLDDPPQNSTPPTGPAEDPATILNNAEETVDDAKRLARLTDFIRWSCMILSGFQILFIFLHSACLRTIQTDTT